jgi:SAM-dependent methyltransferase
VGRNLRFRHPSTWGFQARRALDFGCGNNPRNPFLAHEFYFADILNIEELRLRSRTTGISYQYVLENYSQITRFARLPFNDKFFDVVTAFDVLEHLSRENTNSPNEFISVLNEIHRVLVPGGNLSSSDSSIPKSCCFSRPYSHKLYY